MSFMTMLSNKFSLVDRAAALPGRETAIMTPGRHAVTGVPIDLVPGEGQEEVLLGLGCFWGAAANKWHTSNPSPSPSFR